MASGGGGFRGGRVVGDYMIGRQIGSGSFSVVWLARHRMNGAEVAVKEIVMETLSKKLRESLLSEIVILKSIKHPNIIALHDIIEASGRVYLILEYCRGGDLSRYIQKHGKVPEATAKHFMQQLASGLRVLRENNLVHRDLKPQWERIWGLSLKQSKSLDVTKKNLLLSSSNENSVLKIADFGFARSLQPRGLAETLCGSPLYMAPEIMQLKKYDAKADLWSVGTILFQLVVGKTPFTGNTQFQLLQNIVKSNDVHFPPESNLSHECIHLCKTLLRLNPVERVSFEEFFNHPFLSQLKSDGLMSQSSSVASAGFSHRRPSGGSYQDWLPFPLDDESGVHGSPLATVNGSSVRPTYGFSVAVHQSPTNSSKLSAVSEPSSINKMDTSYGHDSSRHPTGNTKEASLSAIGAKQDPKIVDSLDLLDQDYVIVSGSHLEMSSLLSLSESRNSTCKSENSLDASRNGALSAPMPIVGVSINKIHTMRSLESDSYPEQGSMDLWDTIEQPSARCMTRIRFLQQCTFVMAELVKEHLENDMLLEAFSIQLLILAILKQSLHICHTQAVVAAEEGSSFETTKSPQNSKASPSSRHGISSGDPQLPHSVSSEIEKEFLSSVEHAEELAKDVRQVDEAADMPDAIELIFESALAFGRRGAVYEVMKNIERADVWYSKAVILLHFLLVEAPCLNLYPPVSLTISDQQRLRIYIDVLNNRNNRFRSQRMTLKA